MRAEQHGVQTWKCGAGTNTEDKRHRNHSSFARILFDPITRFEQSTSRGSRGSCESCACVVDVRGAIVIGLSVVKYSFTSVAGNITNSFAGSFDVLDSLRRCMLRRVSDLLFVCEPFCFCPQAFSAARHRFSTTLCRFTGHASTLTYKVRDREFFVELAGFSARLLLPFVQLILVISHPILAIKVPDFHRLVRRLPPLSSTSGGLSSRPGRGRFSWPRTIRRSPRLGY